jgi:hypothetical protein
LKSLYSDEAHGKVQPCRMKATMIAPATAHIFTGAGQAALRGLDEPSGADRRRALDVYRSGDHLNPPFLPV